MIIQNIRLYFEELERKPKYTIKDWVIVTIIVFVLAFLASIDKVAL